MKISRREKLKRSEREMREKYMTKRWVVVRKKGKKEKRGREEKEEEKEKKKRKSRNTISIVLKN